MHFLVCVLLSNSAPPPPGTRESSSIVTANADISSYTLCISLLEMELQIKDKIQVVLIKALLQSSSHDFMGEAMSPCLLTFLLSR